MSKHSIRKRLIGAVASIGLMASLVIAGTTSLVSAAGGPMYPRVEFRIPFDSSDGTFDIISGQTVEFYVNANLNNTFSGWSSDPSSFSAESFEPTLPTGVTISATTFYWSAYDLDNQATCRANTDGPSGGDLTFSIASVACRADMDYVTFGGTWTLTNSSGADVTIDTDYENASITADGVAGTGSEKSNFAQPSVEVDLTSAGVVIPDNWSGTAYITWSGELCFDDDVVDVGDVVDIERVITLNDPGEAATPVPGGSNNVGVYYVDDEYGTETWSPYSYTEDPTYTIESDDLASYSTLYINWSFRDETVAVVGQTLKVSLDMTLEGVSALSDDCFGGGGGGLTSYPTLSTLASGNSPGKGTLSAAKALPTGMPNGAIGNGSAQGPNGDVFYYGMDTSGASPKAVVSRIGARGNMRLAGGTKLSQTIGASSMVESFGWYGTGGSNYVLITSDGLAGTYTLYYGKTASASGKSTKTITQAKLLEVCGADYMSDLSVLSAPTSTPLFVLVCFPEDPTGDDPYFINYTKLVPATGSTMNLSLIPLPKPTAEKPCSYLSAGVNRQARGTQAAVFLYGAIGPLTAAEGAPMETCAGASASDRKLITLSTTMVAKTKTFSSGVFGATEGDLRVAPGKKPNTWIVMAHSEPVFAPVSAPTKGYTVSATGAVVAKRAPTLTASGTIAAPGAQKMDYLEPIKELGNGQWLVKRSQTGYGMSMTSAVAIAKYNPATGAVTTGSVLLLTGFSYPAGKYINATGISSTGVMSYYVLTEANKYKIATWKSYTS